MFQFEGQAFFASGAFGGDGRSRSRDVAAGKTQLADPAIMTGPAFSQS
jgi:hypothetical protein